jgi:hypothetical protein
VRRLLGAVLGAVLGASHAAACHDAREVTRPTPSPGAAERYAVHATPSDGNSGTPATLEAEVAALMDQVADRAPAEHRAEILAVLRDPRAVPVSSADPELSRLLGEIASRKERLTQLRIAEHAAAEAAAAQADPRLRLSLRAVRAADQYARVTLALVSSPPRPGARGLVRREPGDQGVALALVVDEGATPEDVLRAARGAAGAVQRYGASPATRVELALRRPAPAVRTAAGERLAAPWASVLADLRQAPPREVPGVGQVRALDLAVPLAAPPRGPSRRP